MVIVGTYGEVTLPAKSRDKGKKKRELSAQERRQGPTEAIREEGAAGQTHVTTFLISNFPRLISVATAVLFQAAVVCQLQSATPNVKLVSSTQTQLPRTPNAPAQIDSR